jgi:hypothetical protein
VDGALSGPAAIRVAGLFAKAGEGFEGVAVGRLELGWDGAPGDRHGGRTRRACARTPWLPRGAEALNLRQLSLVSLEELAGVAAALGLEQVPPAALGANIALDGAPGLTAWPFGARLLAPSGAVLLLTGENRPCRIAGAVLARAAGRPDVTARFAKAAMGRRGVTAMVERPGALAVGDTLALVVPPEAGSGHGQPPAAA